MIISNSKALWFFFSCNIAYAKNMKSDDMAENRRYCMQYRQGKGLDNPVFRIFLHRRANIMSKMKL